MKLTKQLKEQIVASARELYYGFREEELKREAGERALVHLLEDREDSFPAYVNRFIKRSSKVRVYSQEGGALPNVVCELDLPKTVAILASERIPILVLDKDDPVLSIYRSAVACMNEGNEFAGMLRRVLDSIDVTEDILKVLPELDSIVEDVIGRQADSEIPQGDVKSLRAKISRMRDGFVGSVEV